MGMLQVCRPSCIVNTSSFRKRTLNVLIRFRAKHLPLAKLHYELSTYLGLLQSNMTWLNAKYGLAFHWLPILFQKMDLPVYTGVKEVLKLLNTKRMEALEYAKTSRSKQERKRWKLKRKVLEKRKREQWSKAHGDHDYLGSDGGLDDIRRPSPQKATKFSKPPADDESNIDEYSDMYESDDSDMNIEEMMYERCYCPNYPSHLRTCPFNIKQMSRVLDFSTNCDSTLETGTKLEAEDNERKEDSNSYLRNSGMKNNAEKKPCKCGSVSHTHKDCPSESPLREEELINNVTTEDIFVVSPPPTDEWMSQAAAVCYTDFLWLSSSLSKERPHLSSQLSRDISSHSLFHTRGWKLSL